MSELIAITRTDYVRLRRAVVVTCLFMRVVVIAPALWGFAFTRRLGRGVPFMLRTSCAAAT